MKPDIIPPDFRGPAYESVEKSTLLAIETAHKTIAFLSGQAYLTAEEVKTLGECYRILAGAKEMKMKETLFDRRYKSGK